MSKGFGVKQQTKEQYIHNLTKASKSLLGGYDTPEEAQLRASNMWFNEYLGTGNDYSIDNLLNPEHRKLEIHHKPSSRSYTQRKILLSGFNGLWRILVLERPGKSRANEKSLDFDISVIAGSSYRFHSELIKQSIVSTHGELAYRQWRQLVNSDIDSLTELVQAVRPHLSRVAWSYTCSASSARLCEKAGLKVSRGTAFLFPDSYI